MCESARAGVNGRWFCSFNEQSLLERMEVHTLHYANELLVLVRLAFQKLLQTRQTSRNNKKLSKKGFGYD